MNRLGWAAALAAVCFAGLARAEDSFANVVRETNKKLVKLFGAGGIQGLPSYGTGTIVSPDGYILTVQNHILDTSDLRVHLYDGSRYQAKVVAVEPELDLALLKINFGKEQPEPLAYFDVPAAAKRERAAAGSGVLAFSNLFQLALRDEPMSVQRGVVAAYAKLYGRIGIFEAPYTGNVYVVDAVTNNPGAGGGALTDRKGELLGIIGKELRNELTNTWINYAVPIGATIDAPLGDGKTRQVSIVELVEKKENYKAVATNKGAKGVGGYTGIVLVPNVVERTPPYVEEVRAGSPAAKAGLKPDDLIVYIDGLPVSSIEMFQEVLNRYRPGTEIKLEVQRGVKLTTLTLTLAEPPKPAAPKK